MHASKACSFAFKQYNCSNTAKFCRFLFPVSSSCSRKLENTTPEWSPCGELIQVSEQWSVDWNGILRSPFPVEAPSIFGFSHLLTAIFLPDDEHIVFFIMGQWIGCCALQVRLYHERPSVTTEQGWCASGCVCTPPVAGTHQTSLLLGVKLRVSLVIILELIRALFKKQPSETEGGRSTSCCSASNAQGVIHKLI